MDDSSSLSAIAKAIDKHIEGKASKQLVFDVFRRDRHPTDETTYRVQNAILSALLALDTAEDVLSFRGAASGGTGGDERLRAIRKRRQREDEDMKRQWERQDDGHKDRAILSGRYGGYRSSRYPSVSVARSYFGYRRPIGDFAFDRELDSDPAGLGDRPARKRKLSRRMIEANEDIDGAGSKPDPARRDANRSSAQRRLQYDAEEDDETYQPVSVSKRTNSGEFTCNWCSDHSKGFGTASALYMHIKYKHPKVRLPVYQCKLCQTTFNFQFCIERHVQMKHPNVEVVSSAYRVTPGTDGSESTNGAGNGAKATPNRRSSLTKSKEQQDDPDYQEEEAGDVKNEVEAAKLKSSGGKCPKCDKSFHSIKYLEEHMAVMHSLRPPKYKCPVCGKAFTWVSNMRQHLRTMHQGAKRKRGVSSTPEKKKTSKENEETSATIGGNGASEAVSPEVSDQYSDDAIPLDSQQNQMYKQSVDEDDPSYDDKTERGGYACKICFKVFGTLSGRWRHMHNKHNAPKMRPVNKDGEVYYTATDDDTGKGKVKKIKKRLEKDPEKKDKQVISDRFNYKCTLCGEKFPYPISLFNHMKHVHNSTSAGIVGTPKDGLPHHGKKKKYMLGMPPLSQDISGKNGSSGMGQKIKAKEDMGKKSTKEAKMLESNSDNKNEGNPNNTVDSTTTAMDFQEDQGEMDEQEDSKDSFNAQFPDQLSNAGVAAKDDIDKDEQDNGDMAAESDNIEEFPSSGSSSSSNTLVTDETDSSDSDNPDNAMSQLLCNDEEMHSDIDSPLMMIDGAIAQLAQIVGDRNGLEEDMDDDPVAGEKHSKNLNARRPMGTGDKTCATCGKSYHWSAGLWRHQKTTGHTGTV
jgi:hypothetical protein